MPKLISEVAEALSMNKCYRQNIRKNFYNYKNVVNISKDLYTKVAEMLVQFEKKHDAEYFYSNYFSTIVKETVKCFLNIEKSARTLLASRLADKLFSFFKTPQDKLVNSEIKPKPINQRELDGLQYLSGYFIRTLLKRAKHIYCVKIKLLLVSCQMLYYLTFLKSKIKNWLIFKLEVA